MKRIALLASAAVTVACLISSFPYAAGRAAEEASPVYGVTIPEGYREWEAVAPSEEAGSLNELRIIFGNAVAIKALRSKTLPIPDGAVLVKVGWQRVAAPHDDEALGPHHAFVPGARSRIADVQVMVKDSHKYRASGGWGFGKFQHGVPLSAALHETCFACHNAFATKANDYLFTHYAP